jgi:hypothetical protein
MAGRIGKPAFKAKSATYPIAGVAINHVRSSRLLIIQAGKVFEMANGEVRIFATLIAKACASNVPLKLFDFSHIDPGLTVRQRALVAKN